MNNKKCTTCKKKKILSDFNKNKLKKDGHNNVCKICSNEYSKNYYNNNTEKHKNVIKERHRKVVKQNRQLLYDFYKTHSCKCGENDPAALECDHRDGVKKKNSVSVMVGRGYSWENIKKEIDKCDVMCANCHRKRTAKQQNWYKDLI